MINVEFQQPQELTHLYQALMKAKFEAPSDDLLFSPALADAAASIVNALILQSRKSHNAAMADAMEDSLLLQPEYPQFDMLAEYLAASTYWQQAGSTAKHQLLMMACAPLKLSDEIETALLAAIEQHGLTEVPQ